MIVSNFFKLGNATFVIKMLTKNNSKLIPVKSIIFVSNMFIYPFTVRSSNTFYSLTYVCLLFTHICVKNLQHFIPAQLNYAKIYWKLYTLNSQTGSTKQWLPSKGSSTKCYVQLHNYAKIPYLRNSNFLELNYNFSCSQSFALIHGIPG